MLLFAVGQQTGGRKTLLMLLLLLLLQLPALQGLETSDGVTEPKVIGLTFAKMDSHTWHFIWADLAFVLG